MEDIRIMRKTAPNPSVKTATNAVNTPLVKQDGMRVSLILSVPGVTPAIVAPSPLDTSLGQGILLGPTLVPLILNLTDHGSIVTQAWFGAGQGADASVTILETYLEKE